MSLAGVGGDAQYKYYTHTLNKTHLMVSKKKSAKTKSFGNGFFGWFFPPLLGPHTHHSQRRVTRELKDQKM